jgi:hypothetical protein
MKPTAAVAELLKSSPEWRRFYRQCCEIGPSRLRSQSWQFRDELRERGRSLRLQNVEDGLLMIARKVLPETPAAEWDPEWAGELIKGALTRVQERYVRLTSVEKKVLDLSGQEVWERQMHRAGLDNDPAAFREALRGWERTAGEAFEAAKARSGVA